MEFECKISSLCDFFHLNLLKTWFTYLQLNLALGQSQRFLFGEI